MTPDHMPPPCALGSHTHAASTCVRRGQAKHTRINGVTVSDRIRVTGSRLARACLCEARANERNPRRQEAQQWSTQSKHGRGVRGSSCMAAQAPHKHLTAFP
eukprot:366450-Chlamydomonas_euryale.AAC.5